MSEPKRYLCVEPIDHDGVRHEPGSGIELVPDQAAHMLAKRHIVDPSDLDGDGEPDPKPKARKRT